MQERNPKCIYNYLGASYLGPLRHLDGFGVCFHTINSLWASHAPIQWIKMKLNYAYGTNA